MAKSTAQILEELEAEVKELTIRVEQLGDAGKYAEADKQNKKLEEVKKKLLEKRKQALIEKHKADEEDLKAAHDTIAAQKAAEWDERMRQFETDCSAQIEQLKTRQEQEYDALQSQLDEQELPPLKPSPELTSLRATEKQLAKLKKFQEALKAKAAADTLEEQEFQRYQKDDQIRRQSLLQQLKTQQATEMTSLAKRHDKERKEMCLERSNEIARLEQRYRNLLREQKTEEKVTFNDFEHRESVKRSKEVTRFISPPTRTTPLSSSSTTKTPGRSPSGISPKTVGKSVTPSRSGVRATR